MPRYLHDLLNQLRAPAIAIAVLGVVGKWYLDRILKKQTTRLEDSLAQGTERLKVELARKLAVTQARLQSLQRVSGTVYKARRACRDLNEVVFPQTQAAEARLLKLEKDDAKALVNLVNEKNIALGEASLALEEELHTAKEYLASADVAQLEELIACFFAVRSKVGEFFVQTTKSASFVADLAALFGNADAAGKRTEGLLVSTRKTLLDAPVR